jgi:hypothetical protein
MMHPLDPVPGVLRALPRRAREWLFGRMMSRVFRSRFAERMARFSALGLPPPPANPQDKRATICDPLLDSLESGAVRARPGIARFEGKEVVFGDGTRDRIDVVLFATGYHLRYPYLPADLVDTRDDDLTLFLGTLHPKRHDLFVVGVSRPTGAFWPIAEVQAQLAAALLSGRYALPPQAEIERRVQRDPAPPRVQSRAVRSRDARGAPRAAHGGRSSRAPDAARTRFRWKSVSSSSPPARICSARCYPASVQVTLGCATLAAARTTELCVALAARLLPAADPARSIVAAADRTRSRRTPLRDAPGRGVRRRQAVLRAARGLCRRRQRSRVRGADDEIGRAGARRAARRGAGRERSGPAI